MVNKLKKGVGTLVLKLATLFSASNTSEGAKFNSSKMIQ